MASEKSELLQGTLDLLILKVLDLGPNHGYAIAQRIKRMSGDALDVQQGSLYPALHRLEKKKWLKAEWQQTEGGRDAKIYSITATGRSQLKAEEASWERLTSAIGLVLRATA